MWYLYINGIRYGQNRNVINIARDIVVLTSAWVRANPDDVITRIEYLWFDNPENAPVATGRFQRVVPEDPRAEGEVRVGQFVGLQ